MMIVNLIGISLIGLIVWWFWIKKAPSIKASSNRIDVLVENGVYTPSRIEVKSGQAVTLVFLRKDPSPCAEKVIFEKLGLSLDLPVNKPAQLTIKTDEAGEYIFNCQMKMYLGSLIVSV